MFAVINLQTTVSRLATSIFKGDEKRFYLYHVFDEGGFLFALMFSFFKDISPSAGEEGKNKCKSLFLTDANKQQ